MPGISSPTLSAAKPTHARYWVIAFGVALAALAFMDRICIAQAAPLITLDLGLDKTQMGNIFGAFLLGYAAFGIPAGWFGDWAGPRKALTRIVVAWSIFAALTGWTRSFRSMASVQFLFGAGEAGCFPIITKSFTTWLPVEERTRAQAILWTAARWGGAFTPLLVVTVLRYVSWHLAFPVFGALGVAWAILFYRWYRDDPRQHPQTNLAERELLREAEKSVSGHEAVPWGLLLRSRSVWMLGVQYFIVSFSWYFYLTWLPTFLQEHHKLSAADSARYAIFPLFFCGVGSLFCGVFSMRVTRLTGSVGRTRRLMASVGFLGASLFLALSVHMPGPRWSMCMMATACFFNDWVVPHSWASCMDVGGKYAGTVAGTMNLMANLAGMSSSVFGGYLLQRTGGDWNLFVTILAGVYFLGVFCWPLIDPVTPVAAPQAAAQIA